MPIISYIPPCAFPFLSKRIYNPTLKRKYQVCASGLIVSGSRTINYQIDFKTSLRGKKTFNFQHTQSQGLKCIFINSL